MPAENLHALPPDLPPPLEDGAARHLVGLSLPALALQSTAGRWVDLSALGPGVTVLYCYSRTGRPDEPLPVGWDAIPGARGCTPQACSYRDHQAELQVLRAAVFGVSTQTTAYQQEMVARLHLPFEVLSDAECRLADVTRGGRIEACFYPVFPSDADVPMVLGWLRERAV